MGIKILYLSYVLLFLSLFVGIDSFPFRGEEPRRFIMSMEMAFSGDFFNPTVLGEAYFNKPPFFGWMVYLFFNVFGYNEVSLRMVTIVSSLLLSISSGVTAYLLTKNRLASVLSATVFLSFLDVLFWYGFLGEIDMFLSLIVNLSVLLFFLSFLKGNLLYAMLSGLFCGIGFLTKGFPSFVFFGLFISSVALIFRNAETVRRLVLNSFISLFGAGLILVWWTLSLNNPQQYLLTLYTESFSRVSAPLDFERWIIGKLGFTLTILKMTLPVSVIIIISIISFLYRKESFRINKDDHSKVFYLWVFITFLLFFLFTNSAGRYILPIFPVFAVMISSFIVMNKQEWIKKLSYMFLALAFLRIVSGIIYPELYIKRKGDLKAQVTKIREVVKDKTLTCDCHSKYEVCAYLDIVFQKPIFSSKRTTKYNYRVSCEEENIDLVKEYSIGEEKFYLYRNF